MNVARAPTASTVPSEAHAARHSARATARRPGVLAEAGGSHEDEDLAALTRENIAAVAGIEAALEGQSSGADRVADRIRCFCSSSQFIVLHVVWFTVWILWNTLHGMAHFDPYPFTFLTLVVSLEAIFLSAFVLISQARSGRLDEQRNRMDLQINLLTEQENTKMLVLLDRIAEAVGVPTQDDARLRALQQPITPAALAAQIAEARKAAEGRAPAPAPADAPQERPIGPPRARESARPGIGTPRKA